MKRLAVASILACVLIGCGFAGGFFGPHSAPAPQARPVADAPEFDSAHGVVTLNLTAVTLGTGYPAFAYRGKATLGPTIRVNPGDTIKFNLTDELTNSGMAGDINIHFHGLGSSPKAPSDDVLTMMATPGQTLHYVVHVPSKQPPGLYWYHPHIHNQTNYQVGEAGMSGAIVVEGIAKVYPELANLKEHVMLVRQSGGSAGFRHFDLRAHQLTPNVPCPKTYGGILTVNGAVDPTVGIKLGKPAFFGIINATGHRTLKVSVAGTPMQIVAIDGYPLRTAGLAPMTASSFVVAPAGRVEFVVTPKRSTTLSTLCYDAGPIGDPDPEQLLATLQPGGSDGIVVSTSASGPGTAAAMAQPAALPPPAAHRTVVFSENDKGFYINGKAFEPSAPPMFVVHTGTVEQWTVLNTTQEMHDFHLHQVHFLVTSVDGVAVAHPVWADTFVVPWRADRNGKLADGSVVLYADFRPRIIKGTFLFHCHILDHEDNGMMAKIQAI